MTVLASENLALLSGAPDGIAQLRSLVLDLATHGQLCTQLAEEEPATVLLAEIPPAEQRSAITRRGRLGAESHPEPLEAFPLRAGWCWAKVGDIADVIRGVTYSKGDAAESPAPGLVPLLRGNNINGSLNFEKLVYVPSELVSADQRVKAGDLVIAMSSGSAELVGKAAQALDDFPGGFGAFCGVVRSRSSALLPYLAFFFRTPFYRASAAGKGKGIGINNLQKSALQGLPIPIPPLAEQHRIVAKVDELMALCDRLEARQQDAAAAHARLVQALLDSLTQARDANEFQACWQRLDGQFPMLFTTPASVNGLWSAVLCLAAEGKLVAAGEQVAQRPIGELLLGDTLNGCSYKPSDAPVGIPILRISAGTGSDDFIVDETDHKWVEVSDAEREKFRLQPNDLLACRFNGNLHYVGAFALYNGGSGVEQIFPDKLIRFRVDDKRALPGYLRFVMNALPARQQIESFCATTVGNIGISATNLKTVNVRVPSLDEQHRIVAKVTELLALCAQLKARILAARAKHAQLAEALVAQAVAA